MNPENLAMIVQAAVVATVATAYALDKMVLPRLRAKTQNGVEQQTMRALEALERTLSHIDERLIRHAANDMVVFQGVSASLTTLATSMAVLLDRTRDTR